MKKTLLLSCLLAALAPTAFPSDLEWAAPTDGNLDAADSWTPDIEPSSADRLFFSGSGNYTVGATKDVAAAQVSLNANSGIVKFDLGTHHLETALIVASQDVNWSSGRLSGNLQIANGLSDLNFTFSGANSQFTGSAASVGRSSAVAAASRNSLLISEGASFTTSATVIIGNNDTNTGQAANNNELKVSGTGTTLNAGGGIIVGNLGSGVAGASASGNKLIIEDGANVTTANLLIGRRATGTLSTAADNKVTLTGSASASTLMTINGNVSIGTVGGGNRISVGSNAKVIAQGGNTTINARAGNTLEVNGGIYDAAGRKITGYNLSSILLSDGGSIVAQDLDLQGGSFISGGESNATFGTLTMTSASAFEFAIGTGGAHSLVTISDTATLNGTLRITFTDSFAPSAGQAFRLFDFDTVNGAFSQVVLPQLALNLQWDTSQLYESGVISVIPEPASVGLIGGALFMLVGYHTARGRSRSSGK